MAKHYDQRRAPAPSNAVAPPPVAVVVPSDDEITRRDRPARIVRGALPFLEPGCRSYVVLSGRICKNSVVYGDDCESNVIALDDVQAARFQDSVELLD
jgi:hypothetical protein